jgi:hypothetical protein
VFIRRRKTATKIIHGILSRKPTKGANSKYTVTVYVTKVSYLLCEPSCEERDEVLEVILCKTLDMRLDKINLHLLLCIF